MKQIIIDHNGSNVIFDPVSKGIWALRSQLKLTLSKTHHKGQEITIPAGFKTDFRSDPKFFVIKAIVKSTTPKTGIWYVIHDWLYQHQISTKVAADREQDYWMAKSNVENKIRRRVNLGVRLAGGKYWKYYQCKGTFPFSKKKFKKLKKAGLC